MTLSVRLVGEGDDFMKKIVVVLVVFVANIVSVNAMKLEVRKEDNVRVYEYQDTKIGYRYQFLLSLDEVGEFDKWLIANLANLANPYDEMKNNVIQKMILEYVNPDYEVRLFNENAEVDTSKMEKEILLELKKYDKVPEVNGNYYEVELLGKLEIFGNELRGYSLNGNSVDGYVNKIVLESFWEVGMKKLEFDINVIKNGNYILSDGFRYRPFKVYVNVLGVKADFKIPDGVNLRFALFDEFDNPKGYLYLNDDIRSYSYKSGEKYKLVYEDNYIYEDIDDIYLSGFSEVIEINPVLKKVDVCIKTVLSDIYEKDEYGETFTDITIYNSKLEIVDTCKSDDVCHFNLVSDFYIVMDNLSKKKYYIEVNPENQEFEIVRTYFVGIISSKNIDSIKVNGEEILFDKLNNFYFIDYLDIKSIEVTIDTVSRILDLSNELNYWYINNLGLFYYIGEEKKDEVINNEEKNETNKDENEKKNEEVIKKDEENKNLDVIIEVPNTNVIFVNYVYLKKKYYGE